MAIHELRHFLNTDKFRGVDTELNREPTINSKLQSIYWYRGIGDLDNHYELRT